MINVKKGAAKSLQQTDLLGPIVAGQAVVAGMICRMDATTNDVRKGGVATDLFGFAIQNQTDGDVIDSGKMSLYALDGGSIIETDQSAITINLTNYPLGTPIYPTTGNTGTVTSANTVNKQVGVSAGVRNYPSVGTSGGFSYWTTIPVLAIKLATN